MCEEFSHRCRRILAGSRGIRPKPRSVSTQGVGMAEGRPDDIATRDIRKTVVRCDDGARTEFEVENAIRTEFDGTITNTCSSQLFILQDGTVWEITMQGIRKRDDIGACARCGEPLFGLRRRRNPTKRIRDRKGLKSCADCGRLLCGFHRIRYHSDSSDDVYRCFPCAIRHALKRSRQLVLYTRG
jgi:ribosomal protein L34E